MNRFHYGNTKDSNLLYLLQYRITDDFFFLEVGEKKYVFLSILDIDAFREGGRKDVEAVDSASLRKKASQSIGDKTVALAKAILSEYGINEVEVPSNFPHALALGLEKGNIRLIVRQDWCSERSLKSSEEIVSIEENMKVTCGAFSLVEERLAESEIIDNELYINGEVLTSEKLKREVEHYFLDHEMDSVEGSIISCGKQASEPHNEGSGPLRAGETIIVDLFPQSRRNHYFADMTRTYVKGAPLQKETGEMYEAVARAHEASLHALRPGVLCSEIYDISAQVIKDAGFDVGEKGYVHSLGHGLGVAVHEQPALGPASDTVLEPGMVVTIEPGLYYKEWGGVRVEDTVVITEDGYRNLTNHPQNWLIK